MDETRYTVVTLVAGGELFSFEQASAVARLRRAKICREWDARVNDKTRVVIAEIVAEAIPPEDIAIEIRDLREHEPDKEPIVRGDGQPVCERCGRVHAGASRPTVPTPASIISPLDSRLRSLESRHDETDRTLTIVLTELKLLSPKPITGDFLKPPWARSLLWGAVVAGSVVAAGIVMQLCGVLPLE